MCPDGKDCMLGCVAVVRVSLATAPILEQLPGFLSNCLQSQRVHEYRECNPEAFSGPQDAACLTHLVTSDFCVSFV